VNKAVLTIEFRRPKRSASWCVACGAGASNAVAGTEEKYYRFEFVEEELAQAFHAEIERLRSC